VSYERLGDSKNAQIRVSCISSIGALCGSVFVNTAMGKLFTTLIICHEYARYYAYHKAVAQSPVSPLHPDTLEPQHVASKVTQQHDSTPRRAKVSQRSL